MFAVIKTGGKQYKVAEGQKIQVEKIEGEPEAKIIFDDVLLVVDGDTFELGKPKANATVSAKILRQLRGAKIRVYKMRLKTRYRRTHGHRQYLTEVEILGIKMSNV